MTENTETTTTSSATNGDKTKTSPPDGYVCNLCGVSRHWIQQCSQKKTTKKRKSSSSEHKYQEGVDPSPKDIEQAKKMQQLTPPPCDCGVKSRLKKVKRSHVTENSRAVGSYFFFCAKKKDDPTKCKFAQPVEEVKKTKKDKLQANFFAKRRKEK
jgi:exopolysaccharide biosynthesis protein